MKNKNLLENIERMKELSGLQEYFGGGVKSELEDVDVLISNLQKYKQLFSATVPSVEFNVLRSIVNKFSDQFNHRLKSISQNVGI